MSVIAGVFYFDFRPVPETDETWVKRGRPRSSVHPISSVHPVQLASAPGLLMGQTPSRFDLSADQAHAVLPDGGVCCWDGRLHNRESLLLAARRERSQSSFHSAMAALGCYQA